MNLKIAFSLFFILNLLCIGAGMGVPIFCILFGFVVGWYIAARLSEGGKSTGTVFREVFRYAVICSAVTFILMISLWGPFCLDGLTTPGYNYKNTGIPLILFDPRWSFIGWMVLMIIVSPFLQLLTIIFASFLRLKRHFQID